MTGGLLDHLSNEFQKLQPESWICPLKKKRHPSEKACGLGLQGRIQNFWKVVQMFEERGVRLADFISFFLKVP